MVAPRLILKEGLRVKHRSLDRDTLVKVILPGNRPWVILQIHCAIQTLVNNRRRSTPVIQAARLLLRMLPLPRDEVRFSARPMTGWVTRGELSNLVTLDLNRGFLEPRSSILMVVRRVFSRLVSSACRGPAPSTLPPLPCSRALPQFHLTVILPNAHPPMILKGRRAQLNEKYRYRPTKGTVPGRRSCFAS